MRLSRLHTASLLLICLAPACLGLDPGRSLSQYTHEFWGPNNGFPGGRVESIVQTADGYLWIGTERGLLRFDGQTFEFLRDPNSSPLASEHILSLTSDRNGDLWIRLAYPSLLRYQGGAFSQMQPNPRHAPQVTAMARGPQGSVLFASQLDGIFAWTGTQFQEIIDRASLAATSITSIAQTGNGEIWLGTSDSGLLRFRDKRITTITAGLPSLKVNCLQVGVHGEVYVGTDRGLVRWNSDELSGAGVSNVLRTTPISAIAKDRDGNIWIGTTKGLVRLDSKEMASYEGVDSRADITALFEDREGDLWAGSSNGITRIQESAFTTYPSEDHLDRQYGGPVHADDQGGIWTSSVSGDLYSLHNGKMSKVAGSGLEGAEVYSIAGNGDDLWLGRKRAGLTHVVRRSSVRSLRSYAQADGLPPSPPIAVHQNRNKTIWIGTLNGGVSHFVDGRFSSYTTANGLVSNTVRSIAEGEKGAMWFATPSGLSCFSEGRWKTYDAYAGLPSENLYTVYEDSGDILWLGTLQGLTSIRSGRVFTPSGLPPSLLGQVFGITQDHAGSLWISTLDHVFRVDRGKLISGSLSSGDVREFGAFDGLPDARGITRERSISTDPSGRVWFSRTGGISVVNPERVHRTAASTIVHIDRLSVDGNPKDFHHSVLLPPGLKRIVIGYAGLNLSSPDHVRYRFKLDGFDHDWTDPVAGKEAVYTNLIPGSYRFHVAASNADQLWNGNEVELALRVQPAFWQTAWFRVACAIAMIMAAILAYRLRIYQMTEQVKLQFEARFAERNRIAQDLHDTLLQSFQGLLLRFKAVENMLPDKPAQAKSSLAIAITHAARAITEGRDAVQELRSDKGGTDLVDTLSSLGQEMSLSTDGQSAPSYRVLLEGAPRQLHPRLQDDLYRISREAVANAFRHARATHIELDIRYDPRMLRLRVRDDGIGMDPDILAKGGREGHWGLPGMLERAKAMKGQFEIWSDLNRGTEIELTVPANIAYMRVENRKENKISGGSE
jgi:signal transduction histidine kinase/ligand-binding sensor domain-containing protein